MPLAPHGRKELGGAKVSKGNDSAPPKRQYPAFYEKAVPIALGFIILAIVVLLLVILAVALGFFPGG
jgi:hypothetical protein